MNRISSSFVLALSVLLSIGCSEKAEISIVNQIDVVGLIPDESTMDQLKKATISNSLNYEGRAYILIGGYELQCIPEFSNEKLHLLQCPTGESTDGARWTEASNAEIHEVLLSGFKAKFGAPTSVDNEKVRTAMGVEYTSSNVEWKDKKGNVLSLYKYLGRVNAGSLVLTSAEKEQSSNRKSEEKEKARKF